MERNKYTKIMNKYRTMFNDNLNKDDILDMCSTAIISSILNMTNEHMTCSHFVIALDDHAPNADVITIIIDNTSPKYTKITVKYVNETVKSLELCDDCLYENTIQVDIDSISVKELDSWGEKVVKRISEEFAYAHAVIELVSGGEDILDYIKNNKEKENSEMSYMSFKEFMEQHPEDESIIDVLKKCKNKGIKATIDAMCTIVSELDKKMNELSDKIHSDEEDDVDNEEDGCYYCPGPCCNGCINGSGCDDEDDDDYWDDDDDDRECVDSDIAEVVKDHITAALLMSMHNKLTRTKDISISVDIASNFCYDCFEKVAFRLRENRLRIDTMHRGTPLGGSYDFEVYDRTTNMVVWRQTFDLLNVTPEMITTYYNNINGRMYTTADFSTTDVRAMIFTAIFNLIIDSINEEELWLAIVFTEGVNKKSDKEFDKFYDHMKDWFETNVAFCFGNACGIAKVHTDAMPELEEFIKDHSLGDYFDEDDKED